MSNLILPAEAALAQALRGELRASGEKPNYPVEIDLQSPDGTAVTQYYPMLSAAPSRDIRHGDLLTLGGGAYYIASNASYKFDGYGDYLQITKDHIDTARYIELWFKHNGTAGGYGSSGSGATVIASCSTSSGSGSGWVIFYGGRGGAYGGDIAIGIKNSAGSVAIASGYISASLDDGEWHKVGATLNKATGETNYLYVDGSLIWSGANALVWDYSASSIFRIAEGADSYWWSFNGEVSDLKLLSRTPHDLQASRFSLLRPANSTPFLLSVPSTAPATTPQWLFADSDITKALRGQLLAPGEKPSGLLVPNRKLEISYQANSINPGTIVGAENSTLNNKEIDVKYGEIGVSSPTSAGYIDTPNFVAASGSMTVVQRIRFPLTSSYEMLLYGNGVTNTIAALIRNAATDVIGAWSGGFKSLLSVSGYSGMVTLVTRHKDGNTTIHTSNGDYASSVYGYPGFHGFWGDSASNSRSVGFGSLFYVIDGWVSDAEAEALASDPWQSYSPANSSPYLLSVPSTAPATTPTLSLPELFNLTATSAQPRVTVTF